MSEIVVQIDGETYEGWDDLSVSRNINALCGDFQFTMADFPLKETAQINPGQETVVKMLYGAANILERKLITGYIDRVSRTKAANNTQLSFSGRDKTSDLVDCAAIHKSNTWKKKGVWEIIKDICSPFGINVLNDTVLIGNVGGQVVENFTIQNGETSFAAINRLCSAFGILPFTNSDGELVLSSIGSVSNTVRLEIGENIKDLKTEEDYSGRFSQYICRGQSRGNGSKWTLDGIQLLGEALDPGIERYRPYIVIAEKKMTPTEIARRIAWEAQVRAGRAVRLFCTVRGWLQDPNDDFSDPWEIGKIVEVKDQSWNIDAKLVVSSVTFSLSEGSGRTTNLELCPPEIYKVNPSDEIELGRKSSVRPS